MKQLLRARPLLRNARPPQVFVETSRGGRGAEAHGRRLAALARTWLMQLAPQYDELSVVLVRDREIRRLKRIHFGIDEATDVLSFPLGKPVVSDGGVPTPAGDIVISLPTARRQARLHATTLERELARYLAHGLLHLIGHDHTQRNAATRMIRLEQRLLGEVGLIRRTAATQRTELRRALKKKTAKL